MAQEKCIGIGIDTLGIKKILARDVALSRDGKSYVISVCTPEFLKLWTSKEDGSDREAYYIMDDVSDIKAVCERLSQKTLDQLKVYLTPQEDK